MNIETIKKQLSELESEVAEINKKRGQASETGIDLSQQLDDLQKKTKNLKKLIYDLAYHNIISDESAMQQIVDGMKENSEKYIQNTSSKIEDMRKNIKEDEKVQEIYKSFQTKSTESLGDFYFSAYDYTNTDRITNELKTKQFIQLLNKLKENEKLLEEVKTTVNNYYVPTENIRKTILEYLDILNTKEIDEENVKNLLKTSKEKGIDQEQLWMIPCIIYDCYHIAKQTEKSQKFDLEKVNDIITDKLPSDEYLVFLDAYTTSDNKEQIEYLTTEQLLSDINYDKLIFGELTKVTKEEAKNYSSSENVFSSAMYKYLAKMLEKRGVESIEEGLQSKKLQTEDIFSLLYATRRRANFNSPSNSPIYPIYNTTTTIPIKVFQSQITKEIEEVKELEQQIAKEQEKLNEYSNKSLKEIIEASYQKPVITPDDIIITPELSDAVSKIIQIRNNIISNQKVISSKEAEYETDEILSIYTKFNKDGEIINTTYNQYTDLLNKLQKLEHEKKEYDNLKNALEGSKTRYDEYLNQKDEIIYTVKDKNGQKKTPKFLFGKPIMSKKDIEDNTNEYNRVSNNLKNNMENDEKRLTQYKNDHANIENYEETKKEIESQKEEFEQKLKNTYNCSIEELKKYMQYDGPQKVANAENFITNQKNEIESQKEEYKKCIASIAKMELVPKELLENLRNCIENPEELDENKLTQFTDYYKKENSKKILNEYRDLNPELLQMLADNKLDYNINKEEAKEIIGRGRA